MVERDINITLYLNVGPLGEIEDRDGLLWQVPIKVDGALFCPISVPKHSKLFSENTIVCYENEPDIDNFKYKNVNILCNEQSFLKYRPRANKIVLTFVNTFIEYEFTKAVDVLNLFKDEFRLINRSVKRDQIAVKICGALIGTTNCIFVEELYDRRE